MMHDDDNFSSDEAFEEMAAAQWFRDNVDIRDEDVEEMDRYYLDEISEQNELDAMELEAQKLMESYDTDEDC